MVLKAAFHFFKEFFSGISRGKCITVKGCSMNNFGERGQAAITDALFLLIIVSGLAVLMFFFITGTPTKSNLNPSPMDIGGGGGSGYGVAVNRIAMEYYATDYATSALQTLLYSSTPRHVEENLSKAKEIDYLLAFMKEDYANDKKFSDSTKRLILRDLNLIMASSLPTYDFIFIMRTIPPEITGVSEPVLIILKYTDFDNATGTKRVYYFCKPGPGKESLIEEDLLSRAGSVVKAQPVILRFRIANREGVEKIWTALDMWPAVELPKSKLIEAADKLNCKKVS